MPGGSNWKTGQRRRKCLLGCGRWAVRPGTLCRRCREWVAWQKKDAPQRARRTRREDGERGNDE